MRHHRPFLILDFLESRVLLSASPAFPVRALTGHDNRVPVLMAAGAGNSLTAPTNLTAAASASAINLKWSDRNTSESGFRIYRSTDGIAFALLNTAPKNATSYADKAVAPGVTYSYRIYAYTASATSPASNTASASITPPVVTLPAAPSNFVVSNLTSTALNLTWKDNANNETGFHLSRSSDGITFSPLATLAAGSMAFSDAGLTPQTTYTYRITSFNSAGDSATITTSAATPALPITTTLPVTIYTTNMTTFTELNIDGTTGNDSILVSQSAGTLTITANGQTYALPATFGDIMIRGNAGDDAITVDSSVNIASLLYGGDGNNTLAARGAAKMTIVSLGNGTNIDTGNGINTSFWTNPADTVHASAAETALHAVNRVGQFYQPFTNVASDANYIPLALAGQNLPDPTDTGSIVHLANNSLFGLGAVITDINQGSLGDCFFLAPLDSLANQTPLKLQNMAVDLGDGTYAVRFVRGGITSFVRVDGDFRAGGFSFGMSDNHPGASANLWGTVIEKAYAFFRTAQNTYASLNDGYISDAYADLGLSSSATSSTVGAAAIQSTINYCLANGRAMTAATNSTINNAPLIAYHVYSILGCYIDATGTLQIQTRNPWGVDGAGSDGNPGDGLVTLTYDQFAANCSGLYYTL